MRAIDTSKHSNKAIKLQEKFADRIIGQEVATLALTNVLEKFLGGLNDKDRPIASLLFLGPTGTGKTSTVEALCEGLFESNKNMVRIDCGEFQHSHEIAKLIGSPPGYLGHKETPARLTQKALSAVQTQEMPVSIILFDEIEKASDALWHLLLSILDKGTVTLGDNSTTLFKDCIIIMTSNVGAVNSDHGVLGFGKEDDERDNQQIEDAAMSAARRKFTPEFLNRLDEIVCFKTLSTQNIKEILGLEIRKAQSILFSSNFSKLIPTPAALAELLKRGYDKRYNARSLRRTIEKEIMLPAARAISTNQLDTVEDIVIDYKDDEFKFYAVEA
jgi:ATP-dependent Clp protease ATP-binding subunit ClpB